MSAGSKSVVTLPKALLVVLLSFTVACGADHDKLVIDPEPRPDRPGEVQEDAAAAEILIEVAEAEQEAVESRESVETGPDESAIGPFRVGGDIERPRHLGDRPPIEGLTAMMRSGDYAWGACIFQVTISEKGEVGDVDSSNRRIWRQKSGRSLRRQCRTGGSARRLAPVNRLLSTTTWSSIIVPTRGSAATTGEPSRRP